MIRRIWAAILIAVLLLCACAGAEAPADSGAQTGAADFSRFSGLRIGVQTGTISGDVAEAMIPDIELRYFNTQTDVLAALRARKIDAWACELPTLQFVAASNSDLKIETMLDHTDLAALFARSDRGQALRDQYSAFVEKLWADGTMEEIREKWFSGDESRYTLPVYEALPAVNGTLRMALDPALPPFTFVLNGDEVGYDVDIAARFCEANGYALKIVPMDFNGVIASVQSGKCDFAACGITVTAERAESVLFSSPTYHSGTAMATIQGTAESAGFWAGIGESFEKTFIREDRWQLFLEGIGTTMLITLLAILLGTALGFAMFMICRNGNRFANAATRACTWLVQGTPTVVLLMILYYVVFGSVSVSGITVAVLGFTLTFGAAVYGLIRMGVGTIDRGQYEAACALGHSSRHTFFRIILPQAIPHILPAYQSEVVSLIKATAVVGYIAVEDLTRMGDIIRSRTYEAFFPLIAITVIYFALEALLGFAVSRVRIHIDPRKRSREKILKGCSEQSEASVGKPAMVPGREAADMATQSEPAERPVRIRIEHLRKEYPNAVPLKDVNTEIRSGDVISVIGPSGTGKSTLLRSINQLEHPTAGRIWVNDQEITDPKCDITRVRQKMGMVFQSFNLFGHLTVIENIMLSPVDLLGKSRQEAYAEGMRLLRMVGLAEKALNYPDELSGGQKQRIAIARTLAMDPEVILLDEPTSALDPTMVGEVQAVIRELARSGKTMMIVTHEMNFARSISNRVFFMDEGGIYEDGTPEQIFEDPQRENTRRFIRKLKLLEFSIENRDHDFPGIAGQIEEWCRRNQVSPRCANRIQLAFEEAMQLLMDRLEDFRLQAVCEYSEAADSAEWILRYAGPRMNAADCGDGLESAVLRGITASVDYAWDESDDLPNRLRLEIRGE